MLLPAWVEYSQKNWAGREGICGPLPKTLSKGQTKTFNGVNGLTLFSFLWFSWALNAQYALQFKLIKYTYPVNQRITQGTQCQQGQQ